MRQLAGPAQQQHVVKNSLLLLYEAVVQFACADPGHGHDTVGHRHELPPERRLAGHAVLPQPVLELVRYVPEAPLEDDIDILQPLWDGHVAVGDEHELVEAGYGLPARPEEPVPLAEVLPDVEAGDAPARLPVHGGLALLDHDLALLSPLAGVGEGQVRAVRLGYALLVGADAEGDPGGRPPGAPVEGGDGERGAGHPQQHGGGPVAGQRADQPQHGLRVGRHVRTGAKTELVAQQAVLLPAVGADNLKLSDLDPAVHGEQPGCPAGVPRLPLQVGAAAAGALQLAAESPAFGEMECHGVDHLGQQLQQDLLKGRYDAVQLAIGQFEVKVKGNAYFFWHGVLFSFFCGYY